MSFSSLFLLCPKACIFEILKVLSKVISKIGVPKFTQNLSTLMNIYDAKSFFCAGPKRFTRKKLENKIAKAKKENEVS